MRRPEGCVEFDAERATDAVALPSEIVGAVGRFANRPYRPPRACS